MSATAPLGPASYVLPQPRQAGHARVQYEPLSQAVLPAAQGKNPGSMVLTGGDSIRVHLSWWSGAITTGVFTAGKSKIGPDSFAAPISAAILGVLAEARPDDRLPGVLPPRSKDSAADRLASLRWRQRSAMSSARPFQ